MTPEEFRRHGREVVDWIADYWERVEELPVLSTVEPGEVLAALPVHPPEDPEPFADVMADVERVVLPGITHWQSPNFFGFFPANASPPSVLGELLSAGLGVQGMLWATSPACTELETRVLDWLAELLGLPERFTSGGTGGGVIQDSASSATLCALLAARERVTEGAVTRDGVDRPLRVYATAHAHSSVEKAVRIAGLGSEALRTVETDADGRLDPGALERAIEADRAAGATPCLVVATIGTTSSTVIDPVAAIGAVTARHRVWLHVDAAFAGCAAVVPELRHLHDGLEVADSYCTNPHKWLLTNFDCDAFYVADRRPLLAALSILPEYLRNAASDAGRVIDYRDWQVPLGRRFRALKLWFVLRSYGASGLRAHIREHVAAAEWFAEQVVGHPDLELAAPAPVGLVCFRVAGEPEEADRRSEALLTALNASGRLYLTHTVLHGRYTLRLAVGGTWTRRTHVEQAFTAVERALADVSTPA